MKITFLGTSHGVPAADRYCSCAMVEINNSLYFIDAGAPMIDLILRYGKHPNDARAVFTTHAHGDHIIGLASFIDLCNWYYKEARPTVYMTEKEHGSAILKLVSLMEDRMPFASDRIDIRLAKKGRVYSDENVKITYIPTKHIEPRPSYAILIEAEGKKVIFTGDLSQWLAKEDFPVYALENETDLVVCEMAHFTPEQVKPYVEGLKTKHLCFNHVFPTEKFKDIRAMHESGEYGFPITVACDADEIIL